MLSIQTPVIFLFLLGIAVVHSQGYVASRDGDTQATFGSSCGGMNCPPGSFCRRNRVDCIRAPCPQPRPSCVSSGQPSPTSCGAGGMTCPPGQVCEQGATCMAIGCPPPPPPRCVPAQGGGGGCGYCPPGQMCPMVMCAQTA